MKKIITGMVFGMFAVFPAACLADYVIHLKDGRSYVTSEYREEGDQIKIKRYGGVIGLPKNQVVKIEEASDVSQREGLKPPEQLPVPESGKEAAGNPEPPSEAAENEDQETAGPEKVDPQIALMKEKRRILSEREDVSNAFREAKAKNHKEEKDRYWNQLLRLQKKLEQLQNRATDVNNGTLPPWWEQIQ